MQERVKFSLLMSVYKKDEPSYLKQALDSVLWQTVLPNEFILVEDGPIPDTLTYCIQEFQLKLTNLGIPMEIIKSKKNQGLGHALNKGVKICHFNYVARMDSDDISFPKRFEKQLQYLKKNETLSILGCFSVEFLNNNISELQINELPTDYNEIKKRISSRNPFSHPTVFFKRSDVIKAGNYQSCPYFEDYYLWARMLNQGCKAENLRTPLLLSRVNDTLYLRRGGINYVESIKFFRKKMANLEIIDKKNNFWISIIQMIIAIQPNFVRKFFYSKILRKKLKIIALPKKIIDEFNN